jgi:hypothetical protein
MVSRSAFLGPALFGAVALMVPALLAAADNKACKLLTPAELEPVVGGKLSAFQGQSIGTADVCTASSANAGVILRFSKQTETASSGRSSPADAVAKQLENLRKMGARVEVKTFGTITCHTVLQSESVPMHGCDTFCMVSKGDTVGSVQITAWAEKDVVQIDKLHSLAEKMAGRF